MRQRAWNVALGIVLVLAVLLLLFGAYFMPVLNGNVATPKKHSLSNLKQIALGHAMYMEEFDGFGPNPATWMDQLMPYVKTDTVFKCPFKGRLDGEFGYAYFRDLARIRLSAVGKPEEVVLAFESSDLHWNANGGFERLPSKSIHDDGTVVYAFLDTHVRAFKQPPKFKVVRSYPAVITTPEEVADVLETCDAHSPLRHYVEQPINHDTVGVLLKLAQVDVEILVEGARIFLSKSASHDIVPADRDGREDLLEMLKGLIVDYPGTKVHICWNILINEDGKLRIADEWPDVRMGLWAPRDFCKQLPEDLKKYGRRDISGFQNAR